MITLNRHCTKYPETYKKKQQTKTIVFTNTLWTASSCKLKIDYWVFEVTDVSQRLICPRGKNKMPSAYVKFDGHMTISGIFGNEQFPVVN